MPSSVVNKQNRFVDDDRQRIFDTIVVGGYLSDITFRSRDYLMSMVAYRNGHPFHSRFYRGVLNSG
jgi:hypothetical protein